MFCLFRISGSPTWSQKVQGFILTAWLGLWIQQTSGADVIAAAVGETVNITAQFSGTIHSYTWYRGTAALADQIILTYIGASGLQRPGPQYTGRETGLLDGSLRIRDVLTNYTGNYTAIILTQDGTSVTIIKQLRVYEKVPKPIVRINVSEPIENQPVALTCENSNSATTILWFFNSSPLQPDNNRLTLSSENRTLTISRISKSDDGRYQCEVQNPVGLNTSDPLKVTVSYGPDIPIITPSQNVELKLGNELRLTCTAASYPAAQYQWLHNNTNINNPQSTYTKASSTFEDSGTYTCVANNSVTGLSTNVLAIVKISAVSSSLEPPTETAVTSTWEPHTERVTGPSLCNRCSCWEVTLGATIGVFLCATAVIAGVVFYYKRLLTQMETRKDDFTYQNHSINQKPETPYENITKGHKMYFGNQPTVTDSPYMDLQHGDRATYEQIKR